MGNGNLDVDSKIPTRESGQPMVKRLMKSNGSRELRIDKPTAQKAERPKICGAMSQQRGDIGNFSAPQKFVRLVGCRDTRARPKPWVRPQAVLVKQ